MFIVQAREDDLSSPRNTEYLQRNLGGLVDTLILDDSYHIVTVDRQRDLLIEGTRAFGMLLASRMGTQRKSGEISLNGAAARLAQTGDLLIICTYAPMSEAEAESYKPKVVFVDEKNRITGLKK